MMFTHSELEEAGLMKFYHNDISIYKLLLQIFSADFHNQVIYQGPEGAAVTVRSVTASK